jgi:hypothetical protein
MTTATVFNTPTPAATYQTWGSEHARDGVSEYATKQNPLLETQAADFLYGNE